MGLFDKKGRTTTKADKNPDKWIETLKVDKTASD